MAKYKLTFKKSVSKDLRSIPKKDVPKILTCIESLAENPRAEGCIKLSAQENYRVRQGSYRIVYEIRDEVLIVNVIKVAHRSNVYKNN
ncbi:type II toxin-antitoxin system RelE family toxin [Psychromonas sp. Urea-02u-13]|uniref:type II toxin-antitoxin system RelE family toxin n=1 Tax=Psychromonas sp. Urea-02u-13 TaxID=2058326 RepID=UPI000C342525|nr:type II toxin-antitoxin system RelE/ParE family toxin [Psychromonas sp. Urea-02u-13]PKG37481.1 type II toxin-antitoxin system mRNA interferase toxin, RelE/StbE family [Psychromonas sp. Urea-02u-13]